MSIVISGIGMASGYLVKQLIQVRCLRRWEWIHSVILNLVLDVYSYQIIRLCVTVFKISGIVSKIFPLSDISVNMRPYPTSSNEALSYLNTEMGK